MERNNYPRLHNACWPGVVGKGTPDSEPFVGLDTLLELTASAEHDGQKFDGVDLWLADPHISIDSTPDDIKRVIEGVLVKTGSTVRVSVRRALGGATGLARLRETVEREFLTQDEDEVSMRQVMAKLEAGFLRRLEGFRHG